MRKEFVPMKSKVIKNQFVIYLLIVACCLFGVCNIRKASKNQIKIDNNIQETNEEDNERSNPTFTYFNGNALDISLNYGYDTSFSSYYSSKYLRFYSNQRQFVKLNYSGPAAKMYIYYSNFFLSTDYLEYYPQIHNSVDCHFFDYDCEYIIELKPITPFSSLPFSVYPQQLTTNLQNNGEYIFHQTFVSSSNVGYRYEVELISVNTSTYNSIDATINSYSNSTTYSNGFDTDHYFYNPSVLADNRLIVDDTGYDEYNAVSFSSGTLVDNCQTYGYGTKTTKFSGAFISNTTILTCAHTIFASYWVSSAKHYGLNKDIYFYPGVNTYGVYTYGVYKADEIYCPVTYVLEYCANNNHSLGCTANDWAICLTHVHSIGQRSHSVFGVTGFSYSPNLLSWSHARCAGYPIMEIDPYNSDYLQKMWTNFPLENSVSISSNGKYVQSNSVIISSGNSGCPLYYKSSSVYQGHTIKTVNILGIASGHILENGVFTSYFYRNTAFIVNMIREVGL